MNPLQTLRFSKISSQQTHYKDIPLMSINTSFQDNIFSNEQNTQSYSQISFEAYAKYQHKTKTEQSHYPRFVDHISSQYQVHLSADNQNQVPFKQYSNQVKIYEQLRNNYRILDEKYTILSSQLKPTRQIVLQQFNRNQSLKQIIAAHQLNLQKTSNAIQSYITQNINSYRDSILFSTMNEIDKFQYQYYDGEEEELQAQTDNQINSCTLISEEDDILKLLS